MSLATDLLSQANRLATQEPRRPRQASLRRAVSAAYYALFHLLVDAATKQFVGSRSDLAEVRHVLARGYDHRQMVEASKAVSSGTLPAPIRQTLAASVVPPDLRLVAEAFVVLQHARHEADYNLAKAWTRSEVLAHCRYATQAFQTWQQVSKDRMAILYLGLLGSFESVRRR